MPRGSTLNLQSPADYRLARDVCSYGYFLLRPNRWEPKEQVFELTIALEGGAATARITQSEKKGSPLRSVFDRALSPAERTDAKAKLARSLRLDEPAETIRAFHTIDPRWKRSGRGRLLRATSLFEDIIKTVTSCNVAWTSTIRMNQRLCEVFGEKSPSGIHAFPSAQKLARTRPSTLRGRCGVGYRDQRIVDLAKLYSKGEIDPAWLEAESTTDDDAFAFLLTLPGIGPYAAGNIMQLLGRYSRLALDTESVRHAKAVLGMKGTDAQLMKRLATHYDDFAEHKFRSYWFELWDFYESKRGKAWTWDRDTTGKTFTASQLAETKPQTQSQTQSKTGTKASRTLSKTVKPNRSTKKKPAAKA